MPPVFLPLRAAWLTARRAGLGRSLYRLQRRLRLRLLDPCLAGRLYPLPALNDTFFPSLEGSQRSLLARLASLRLASPLAGAWDRLAGTLTLLNQAPFSLSLPTDWPARPMADPLWAFQLHG